MSVKQQKPLLGSLSTYVSDTFGKQSVPPYSFLHERHSDIDTWRSEARACFESALKAPNYPPVTPKSIWRGSYDGVSIEKLSWQLPFGSPTEAYLLTPEHMSGPLPGILALHDHGNNKFLGKSKIVRTEAEPHKAITTYQRDYYGDRAWAHEFAKQGYAVLAHDIFPFESRRIRFSDVPGRVIDRMLQNPNDTREPQPGETDSDLPSRLIGDADDTIAHIDRYNTFARELETVIAKSLYAAGMTWPGLTVAEDRVALSVLSSLPQVDPTRIGVCGLSLGGLRSVYLAGSTSGIACSATIGFMTTWNDFITSKALDHTWMVYLPELPQQMEFADILAMRAPAPSLVISATEDPLFSLPEVQRAEKILRSTYQKADAESAFTHSYYPGGHCFHQEMQHEVLAHFSRYLYH